MERLRAEVSAAHSRKRVSGATAPRKPLTSWQSAFAEVSLPWDVGGLGPMHQPNIAASFESHSFCSALTRADCGGYGQVMLQQQEEIVRRASVFEQIKSLADASLARMGGAGSRVQLSADAQQRDSRHIAERETLISELQDNLHGLADALR